MTVNLERETRGPQKRYFVVGYCPNGGVTDVEVEIVDSLTHESVAKVIVDKKDFFPQKPGLIESLVLNKVLGQQGGQNELQKGLA